LLEDGNMMSRTFSLLRILQRELQFVQLKQNISERTREELDQQQKEYYLQQQIKNFQKELGNAEGNDAKELKDKAKSLTLPDNVQRIFEKEVTKLERMNASVPDYSVVYNYLDTILALPWGKWTTDNLDLRRAQRVLDRDHYGMEKVKERILEHLAVMKVSKQHPTTILCLYGPPGVGKTSLCRSIAESLGRKYQRISLGGVHDESEIRGHRRTYIAAMCGRIMKTIIKAESNNPLLVLDEIDKVGGRTHHGDPQAALLELLDPEQNNTFHDNFLDFDYDLSHVFFIATANSLSSIPAPLRDRMELINVEGYLTEEKKEIAKKHLFPQALAHLELPFSFKISPTATEFLIEKYTRESGVRQLEKQIAKLVRKVVLNYQTADEKQQAEMACKTLKPADVEEIMGTPPYNRDAYQGNDYAGVVNGLAWTSVGGEMLFIESGVSRSKNPRLALTGNLGDVMKESALLALEYVKSHISELGVDYHVFEHWNIHLHFPEGAVPKDGPSAGITIATSLASTLTQRKVRPRLSMTGEITLRGKVLPVGGIKEKILAAKRAGITDIILSQDNEKNVLDIPERYVKGLTFHYVSTVSEVWKIALLDEKVANPIDLVIPSSKKKHSDNEQHNS
jgi:endopeptidase La